MVDDDLGPEGDPDPREDVIVCRCEDVSLKELEEAIDRGARTLDHLKKLLRIGMGHCQGRTCLRLAASVLARKLGVRIEDLEFPTVRPPVLPVEIGKLAEVLGREGEG